MTKFNQMTKFGIRGLQKIVGKGENAGYQHFLLFPQCFRWPSCVRVVEILECLVKS